MGGGAGGSLGTPNLYYVIYGRPLKGPVDWPDALMAPMKPFFLIGGLTSTPGTLTGGIPATLAPAMAREVWVAIVLFRFSSRASLTTFVQLVGYVTKNQLSKDFKHEYRSWTTRSSITIFLFFLKNASFIKRLTNHSNFFQNKLPMSETVACQILIFRKNILQWGPITGLVQNVILICDIFKILICDNCTSNPSLLSGWIPSSLSDGGWHWTGEGRPTQALLRPPPTPPPCGQGSQKIYLQTPCPEIHSKYNILRFFNDAPTS